MCLCLCLCMRGVETSRHSTCVEVKGQLYGVGSFLLPMHGFRGSNLGGQACVVSALPIEPSCQSRLCHKARVLVVKMNSVDRFLFNYV